MLGSTGLLEVEMREIAGRLPPGRSKMKGVRVGLASVALVILVPSKRASGDSCTGAKLKAVGKSATTT